MAIGGLLSRGADDHFRAGKRRRGYFGVAILEGCQPLYIHDWKGIGKRLYGMLKSPEKRPRESIGSEKEDEDRGIFTSVARLSRRNVHNKTPVRSDSLLWLLTID